MFVTHRRQKDLRAVFHGEHVVHTPGRDAAGHRVGGLAGGGELHHVLGHQEDVVFEQGRLHLAAFARQFALAQCGHGTDGPEHATHDVVHAGACTQRVADAAGHVGQAAHHLHHFVECSAVVVRAGQEAFVADVDEARVQLLERGIVQAQLLHGAGFEVLADDVGGGDQPQGGFNPGGLFQVQRNAFFVAVEGGEKPRARAQQAAGVVSINRLDLDHLGPQVAQQHAAGGAHHHVGEFDDPHTCVRQVCFRMRARVRQR